MCACRPLPVSLCWQGKGVNMSYGQEAHMFSAVSMSWRRATVPWKEAHPCSRHGQRPCFFPQGQEVVWRLLVLGSLCWWSSTTRWWTTTSWSWPGSSMWTPICCTAHAGMCFSLFTCEATKRFRSNAPPPPPSPSRTLTETLRTMDLSVLRPFLPGQPKLFANFLDRALGLS